MKGQVAVFAVLAVIIVIFAVFVYLAEKPKTVIIPPADEFSSQIRSSVQFCVDKSVIEGIREFGLTGGLPTPLPLRPSAYVNGRNVGIYRLGLQVIETKTDQYQGYLAESIAKNIGDCVYSLRLNVSPEDILPRAAASIEGKQVLVSIDFPLRLYQNSKEVLIPPAYYSKLNINVLPFISEAKAWAFDEASHEGYADLSRMGVWQDQGWIPTMIQWDNQTRVILIEDSSQKIGNENFRFQFATSSAVIQ